MNPRNAAAIAHSWNRSTLQLSGEGTNDDVLNAVPIERGDDAAGVEVLGIGYD